MHRFARIAFLLVLSTGAFCGLAAAKDFSWLYQAKAIVTGTGDINREIGFRKCLDAVVLRVSGNQRLLARPEIAAMRDKAGSFVDHFSYRDRLEGVPVHDEQGTHDRPQDLTCFYGQQTVNDLLRGLGGRPWLSPRPKLAIFLTAQNASGKSFLSADGDAGSAMRDSFSAAADPLALPIAFVPKIFFWSAQLDEDSLDQAGIDQLDLLAAHAGADQALAGSIVWSDKDAGWIANWRMDRDGRSYDWQVKGVNFDEAFRVALRGAAQILSGNGQP